jgi:hypothetical protein
VKKTRPPLPLYLLYAGIIHAIGLALLLPMIVTLPMPSGKVAPSATAINIEILPTPRPLSAIEPENEQTSALPEVGLPATGDAADSAVGEAEVAPDAKPEANPEGPVADVSPAVEPEPAAAETTKEEEGPAKAEPEPEATEQKPEPKRPAKAERAAVKKPVAHARPARPAPQRTARVKSKPIRPFDGALSGLFAPGAPAKHH